ncbi:MAG: GAF domain-containing protein, partial [Proteobacteria bacterium]|nr:GAF domain-containing protein [Pseudomonadota bacterium]
DIEVCTASAAQDIYKSEDRERLGLGLYCETVVGTRDILNIPDALADEQWKSNPDIRRGMVAYLGMPLKWPDGEIFGTICVLGREAHPFLDLHIEILAHLRMAVETDLHMLSERQRLERLCHEKDLALREAHHRIMNHLHMLSGLIQLGVYGEPSTAEEIAALLGDLTDRIRAIAMLHSHIASAEGAQVPISDFIETIAVTTIDTLASKDIDLKLDLAPMAVNRRTFFHLGLLVSELITNAIKHAFAETSRPEIHVTLRNIDENAFSLQIRDNGPGLPAGLIPEECTSIGMMLISDLPVQMGGSHSIRTDHGAVFDFTLEKRAGEPDPPLEQDKPKQA